MSQKHQLFLRISCIACISCLIAVAPGVSSAAGPSFENTIYYARLEALTLKGGSGYVEEKAWWPGFFGWPVPDLHAGIIGTSTWLNQTQEIGVDKTKLSFLIFGDANFSYPAPVTGEYSPVFMNPLIRDGWASLTFWGLSTLQPIESNISEVEVQGSRDRGVTFQDISSATYVSSGNGLQTSFNLSVSFDPMVLQGLDAIKVQFAVAQVPEANSGVQVSLGLLFIGLMRSKLYRRMVRPVFAAKRGASSRHFASARCLTIC